MELTRKQKKQIEREYPGKSPEQIAAELKLKTGTVYRELGLQADFWDHRLESATGYVLCAVLLCAPVVFIRGLSNFADLPQRVFVQTGVTVLSAIWLVRAIVIGKIRFVIDWSTVCVAAFMLWPFMILPFSGNRYEGLYAATHWAACGLVFYFISNLARKDVWIRRIGLTLVVAGIGVVLLGVGQKLFGLRWVPARAPFAAAFANVNMAAQYLVMILPVFIATGGYCRNIFLRVSAYAFAVLTCGYLFYTNCRAAWFAVAVSCIWTGYVLTTKKMLKRCIAGLAVAMTVVFLPLSAELLQSLPSSKLYKTVGGSALYRLIVWNNSLSMIQERPIQGFGPGSFRIYYPGYIYRRTLDVSFDKEVQIRRAHNDFIQVGVETGLVGLVLFAGLLAGSLFRTARGYRNLQYPLHKAAVVGCTAGIVAFISSAFFSFPLQRSIPPLLLFAYLGVATALLLRNGHALRGAECRLPRAIGVVALAVVLVAGGALLRYNMRNITCDRYFRTAMKMEKRGLNKKALANGLKAHEYNRGRVDVLSTVGRAYVTTGKIDKGIATLEHVTRKHPYNLNAAFILGVAYANNKETEKALENFRKVLKIKPDFAEAKKIVAILKATGTLQINLK